jgi:uncharacterized protein (DUF58 family)
MTLVSPELLQRLSRSRLLVRSAVASVGIGERRSRSKGVGIEFADHRPYQLGDDIRYLDQHVHARLGENYIRQYSVYQQLPITILLDASRSMRYGAADKFAFATSLTAALGYLALVGGDRILVGAFGGSHLDWFTPLHGVRRAQELFSWLERLEPAGVTDIASVARSAMPRLRPEGLLLLISDLLAPGFEDALTLFGLAKQDLVGVQVVAAEEEDPDQLGSGELRLVDAETGSEIELSFDADQRERYRDNYQRWRSDMRQTFQRRSGLFLTARSDVAIDRLLLQEWRSAGLIA